VDPLRRSIILKEIEHWRRSRLLPDKYCDFLLNLYRDHDAQPRSTRERILAFMDVHPLLWLLYIAIIGIICYLVLHFTSFPPPVQLAVFVGAVAASLGASVYCRRRKPLLSNVLFGLGSAVLLLGWLLLSGAGGAGEEAAAGSRWAHSALYIACCGGIWIVFGILLRLPWAHLCGWAAIVTAYSLLVNRLIAPQMWLSLELCWLPVAALFAWAGRQYAIRTRQSGAVFLVMACLVWFVPEAYALAFTGLNREAVQAALIVKIAALGAAAFFFRKHWTEWVA